MRLLAYIPGAGISHTPPSGGEYVRDMVIDFGDHPKPDVGHHDELYLFDLRLTDVDVYHEQDGVHLCLPDMNHIYANFDMEICRSQEYQFWMGDNAPAPSADAIVQAHIVKGRLPNLHKDFDTFVEWLFDRMREIPRLNIDHMVLKGKGQMYDANTKNSYDLWGMFRYWLMLGRNLTIGYSLDNQITFNDTHISEKGVRWWLIEHNKQLMEVARENDLLAAFITFGSDSPGSEDEYAYTFVGKEGNFMRSHVDVSEFMHLAVHGHFPELVCDSSGKNFNVTFNFAQYFPEEYHAYQNYRGGDYHRALSRFV